MRALIRVWAASILWISLDVMIVVHDESFACYFETQYSLFKVLIDYYLECEVLRRLYKFLRVFSVGWKIECNLNT